MTQSWEEMLAAQREADRKKKEELQKLIQNGGLKEWADRLTAEGKELKMHWDGGGDSGWVEFLIDDEEPKEGEDAENAELLREMCYSELDYGSWAGEFQASGDAIYDPEIGAFEGTDYYSEDDQALCTIPITVIVPSNIWFDELHITVQDEEIRVEADFVIKNGFDFPLKEEITKELEQDLNDKFDATVEEFLKHNTEEFRSMWEEIKIPFSNFKDMGDGTRQAVIESFNVGIFREDPKEISISLIPDEE